MINSNALTDLQRAQRELFDAQRKTATQREAEDLKGYGSDARTVVSLDRMRAQAEAYKASAEELTTRLDLQDAHIGRAADVVGTLREKLTNALALGDLSSVGSDISAAFSDLKSSFNATLNGKYMFGGNLPTEAPIVADSISDLANNHIWPFNKACYLCHQPFISDSFNAKRGRFFCHLRCDHLRLF